MRSLVIYHDFCHCPDPVPASGLILTGPVLKMGRRLLKTAAQISTAVNAACLFLCGTCIAVSLLILFTLSA